MKPPAKIVRTYCEDYIAMIAALPATAVDCAERTGYPINRVRTALRNLRRLGVLRCEVVGYWRQRQLVYRLGSGPSTLFYPAADDRADRPPSKMEILAAVLSMLGEPAAASDISMLTGVDHRTVLMTIATLRKHKLVRIAAWERTGKHCLGRFCLGAGPDAQRPPKTSRKEINRRYWAARRAKQEQADLMRRICGVAAVNDDLEQEAA